MVKQFGQNKGHGPKLTNAELTSRDFAKLTATGTLISVHIGLAVTLEEDGEFLDTLKAVRQEGPFIPRSFNAKEVN